MRLVILESPFTGDTSLNIKYARRCVADCLARGESPIASHLLYTQPGVLNDQVKEERELGIKAGHAWIHVADAIVIYVDLGISEGMLAGVECGNRFGKKIEYRDLDKE
jgi:hypothetical protein